VEAMALRGEEAKAALASSKRTLWKLVTAFIGPADLVRRHQAGGKRRCTGGAHEQRGRSPSGAADGWAR
jgi:hypothetical protein